MWSRSKSSGRRGEDKRGSNLIRHLRLIYQVIIGQSLLSSTEGDCGGP